MSCMLCGGICLAPRAAPNTLPNLFLEALPVYPESAILRSHAHGSLGNVKPTVPEEIYTSSGTLQLFTYVACVMLV